MLEELRRVPVLAGLINSATGCIPSLSQGVERRLDAGSRPGDTRFQVRLPLAGVEGGA